MQKSFELRGVPASLARDGWWLSSEASAPTGAAPPVRDNPAGTTGGLAGGAIGVIALLVLGDFLFWKHSPGLSLAIFVLAIVFVAGLGRPWHLRIRALAVAMIGAAPVVDYVQALSVSFLIAGLILALAQLSRSAGEDRPLWQRALDLLIDMPSRWMLTPRLLHLPALGHRGLRLTRNAAGQLSQPATRNSLLRDWALPVGGSLVFLSLILGANPVLLRLGGEIFNPLQLFLRALFWIGLAMLILPFLMGDAAPATTSLTPAALRLSLPGLNPRSVLRALILFNLLIGVQMISDASILIGGASLPEGLTPAEYARRGAWPLLATTMLAGAFTLAARPFAQEHRVIRPLLLLWLAQNILLTGAAALRLDLYIDRYGLTFLRLYALIWMALVAFGLGLMVWQSLTSRSNSWLISRLCIAGISVLYAVSFINLSSIVAERNLSILRTDYSYICELGPMVSDVVLRSASSHSDAAGFYRNCDAVRPPVIDGWRDWGFRRARVLRNLQADRAAEQAGGPAG